MTRMTSVFIASVALFGFLNVGSLTIPVALAGVNQTSAAEQVPNKNTSALVDINSASLKELRSLPGIGRLYSKKIVEGRPYKAVDELRTRKVLPKGIYAKIQDKVVARTK